MRRSSTLDNVCVQPCSKVETFGMWKLLLAFVVFAAGAVYLLSMGGDIDMSGEKHGSEATHSETSHTTADSSSAASAPEAPLQAASATASAASN
jgi:hypothetical protein